MTDRALTVTDRCIGHCCKHFFIPYSPEEIESMRLRVTEWSEDGRNAVRWLHGPAIVEELGVLADMLIFRGERDGTNFYDCRHLGPDQNCQIYETRPRMCSAYPYGRRCSHAACTWTEARRVRLPIYRDTMTVDVSR